MDRTLTEEFPVSKALRKSARQKKLETKSLENGTATAVSTYNIQKQPQQAKEMVHMCTVYLAPSTTDRLADHRGELNTEVSFQWVTLPSCLSWMESSAESHVYGSSLRAAIKNSPEWISKHPEWHNTPHSRVQLRKATPQHLSIEELLPFSMHRPGLLHTHESWILPNGRPDARESTIDGRSERSHLPSGQAARHGKSGKKGSSKG